MFSELPKKRELEERVKILTWNVCGIRSLLKKDAFQPVIEKEDPDIICLNETRIQESHVSTIKGKLPSIYNSYFSCSSAVKGYSGVAILSKVEPISVKVQGIKENDEEGRTLIAEFDRFYVVCTYVPCAGVGLRRLNYRVNGWDFSIRETIKVLQESKFVIWCGDLNVINEEIDIYSLKGKEKSACCTKDERNSFKKTLEECKLVDSLRVIKPELKDYSFFPRRNVKAREKGQGWRLDYILVSEELKGNVEDSSIRNDYLGSDHYPVITVLKDI